MGGAILRSMAGPQDELLRETLLERQVVYQGRLLTLRHDVVLDSQGARRNREVVVHPGAVAVVPLRDDGAVLLVRQYRHAVGEICLEIPAGTLDRHADGSLEEPAEACRRELLEETGYDATAWHPLGRFYSAPGFTTEELHLYLATGLVSVEGYAGPAADERLELVTLDWRRALELAEQGDIRDAKTLVGLFRLSRLDQTGSLAELRAS